MQDIPAKYLCYQPCRTERAFACSLGCSL